MRASSDQNQTKMAAVLRVLEDHQLSPFCWFLFYLVALIPTWEPQIFSTKNSNIILDTLCPPTHQILKQTPYKQDFATITSHRRNPWHAASRRRSQDSNPNTCYRLLDGRSAAPKRANAPSWTRDRWLLFLVLISFFFLFFW